MLLCNPLSDFGFTDGTDVRRLGYGAMRLTGQPGNFGPYEAWDDGKKLLERALELGINFIDTARAYGPGWNERLIAEALRVAFVPYGPLGADPMKHGAPLASAE